MPVEKPIPDNYIEVNQEHWRNARRGFFTKPHELVSPVKVLHDRMLKTFDIQDVTPPIMVWSTVFDKPDSPSSQFTYAERYPEEIQEADKRDFHKGIVRITEYATNYATREFLRQNATPFSDIYGALADQATYGLIYNGTYRRMKAIEQVAENNGKNYKHALFKGLFNHELGPINELIEDTTKYSGWHNINDLAIEIGRERFKKPDLGKHLDKLEVERTDPNDIATLKNCGVSILAGGVFRIPGVVEVSGGFVPIALGETTLIYAANQQLANPDLFKNLAVATIPFLAVTPFASMHETIHYYSANKEYMGYIPAKLIKKEVTPYFTRLEPEQ